MAQRSDGPHTPPPPLVIEADFNHYEVLGVEPTADSAELKRAFAAAAKLHHPDKSEGTPSAFLRVQRAYEVLRDASSRRSYDATLVELRRRRLLFTPGSNELLPRTAATPVPVACVATVGRRALVGLPEVRRLHPDRIVLHEGERSISVWRRPMLPSPCSPAHAARWRGMLLPR